MLLITCEQLRGGLQNKSYRNEKVVSGIHTKVSSTVRASLSTLVLGTLSGVVGWPTFFLLGVCIPERVSRESCTRNQTHLSR